MITISLCMIVKNEEAVLQRCLDSVADLVDEIIIVDTGSTDATETVAAGYTEHVYHYQWCDDFSAARNYAFSKASCEYIYSADADEILDEENRERFRLLKAHLLPEVEIVQMRYGNQLEQGSVYNYDEEYRPKLFKRLRPFVWEEAVHEMVRLAPVIYDSDIIITHKPVRNHAGRDLRLLHAQTLTGKPLSKRLHHMYAQELFLSGEAADFQQAASFFGASAADVTRSAEEMQEACCVAARAARLAGDVAGLLKYSSKLLAQEGCSEICLELGAFYEERQDWEEALIWYYNAAYETSPVLALQTGARLPLEGLIRCYDALQMSEQAAGYRQRLETLLSEK